MSSGGRRRWAYDRRAFVPRRVIRAAQAFVQLEASSGIALLAAAMVALVWANLDGSYSEFWHRAISLDTSAFRLDLDLRHAVNDGLMTLFFFLMGLEIKRELVHGELSEPRRALLPAAAALGGMLVPAAIYTALNWGGEGADGWGIPMATDIAFALGVLSLLGRRIPFSVKVFLLALAIADDIGAILVIALFYTSSLDLEALGLAFLIMTGIVAMNRGGVRSIDVYVVVGMALWLAVFESGVHATLTGVALGLMTPAAAYYPAQGFSDTAEELARRFREATLSGSEDERQSLLAQVEDLSQGTEAPLDRLERALHPWVSFGVVPLFALANAGVLISADVAQSAASSPVSQGVALGLVLGKPAGICLLTLLAVRLRLCTLPTGANLHHVVGVGLLGGIGFTVSLLVTDLAFQDGGQVDEAKLGVLCASAIAGVLGLAYLWLAGSTPGAAGPGRDA
ncbi:MAG TPA: Na+/H+ antiporter NhaA [Dehalococcoidia bacterium]|nr:Na+/H+ antiporter NhaA [Dehalococcoidia bacterium]